MKQEATNRTFNNLSSVTEVFNRRYGVEVILPDGERRYFRSRSCNKKEAEKEILAYVSSIEYYLNRPVFWRYASDKVYRMGNLSAPKGKFRQKLKDALGYFFDVD